MAIKIPEGYHNVTPYLILSNPAAFIEFTQQVFDAELLHKHMRDENIIMHAEVKIGSSVIMFAASTSEYAPQPAGLFIYVEDADATYAKALSNGATALTPLGDQVYGRSGGVQDAFGNSWWITSII